MNTSTTFFLFISILALIIISIVIINSCIKTKKNINQNKIIDGFMDYQDVKTKTLNWCNKMQANGLLNTDQYDQCVSSFRDVSSGSVKSGLGKSRAGMDYDYSLYNTRKKELSPSVTNENSNTIMIRNNENLTIACRPNGSLYSVSNIDDPTVNQKELYFTLEPINNTAYSILSPYGAFLVADNKYNATFTGKSMGPLATWNLIKINNEFNTSENISTVMFESVQFPNFNLTYTELTDNTYTLKIKNGKTDDMIWSLQAKSNNTGNVNDNAFTKSQYFVTKENILAAMKKNLITKASLQASINTINDLITLVRSNMDDIRTYVKEYLEDQQRIYNLSYIDYQTRISSYKSNSLIDPQTQQNLINSVPMPSGLDIKPDIINQVITSIDNYKNTLLQNINNNGIIPLQQQLNNLMQTDTAQIDYNQFISDLNQEIKATIEQITQNKAIISRQKDEYTVINSDYANQNNTIMKLDSKDELSTLNMNLLSNYQSQKNLLNKLYPFVLFLMIIATIYLGYITFNKFVENIWSQYT
jgi:hypothetical protein